VSVVRATLALLLALGLQAGLGRLWPFVHDYLDLLMLPVVWFAIGRSQAAATLIGCAAGLLQDAWFQAGVFGLNGFKKTLIGWGLGGVGARFDLNTQAGRLTLGFIAILADAVLDVALRRLLDLELAMPGPLELLGKAVLTGLLATWLLPLVDRAGARRGAGRTM
jgi:rod shape-determining protein MreD